MNGYFFLSAKGEAEGKSECREGLGGGAAILAAIWRAAPNVRRRSSL